MALRFPIPGGVITQRFGLPAASVASREPAMWYSKQRAYWLDYPGGRYYLHVHPGLDIAAGMRTPILAPQDGVVEYKGWGYPGLQNDPNSGYMIIVRINKTTLYRFNHLYSYLVNLGQRVEKGQPIATVGMSGNTTGPHTHMELAIYRVLKDGVGRYMLYNPELYLPGGSRHSSKLIRP